jgi:hypothetical protein
VEFFMKISMVALPLILITSSAIYADENEFRFPIANSPELNIYAYSDGADLESTPILINDDGTYRVEADGNAIAYKSCKEYVSAGFGYEQSGFYELNDGTKTWNVECDMETDGGGWTKVYSEDSYHSGKYNINFPTYNDVSQTEALIIVGSSHYLDYSENNTSHGNYRANGLGLDRTLLRIKNYDTSTINFLSTITTFDASCDGYHPATIRTSNYTVLEQSPDNYCYRGNNNNPTMCAAKLKVTLPENTYLLGMTDVESSYGSCYSDNSMQVNYPRLIRRIESGHENA